VPDFTVELYKDGRLVGASHIAEAATAQEAAEAVHGGPLAKSGKLGQLRARVLGRGGPPFGRGDFYLPSSEGVAWGE
jgi:hypothetical protein